MRLSTSLRFTFLALLAACGGSGDGPTAVPDRALIVSGRAERGASIKVLLRSGKDTSVVTTGITASPADAATILANGDIALTRPGTVTFTVTTSGTTLTTTVSVATPPAIVFDGLAAGNRDIYSIELDGANLVRLTTNNAEDVHPTAAAGTILFTSYRDTNPELYTMPVGGGTQRRLTTSSRAETQPVLSPDGKRIAFSTNVSGLSKVWVGTYDATAGVSGLAPLSSTAFGGTITIEGTPTFAPTSDKVALIATATPSGSAGIFTSPAVAGSVPTLVTGSGAVVEVEPSWSFDGKTFVFAAVNGSATEIYTRDITSSTATRITNLGGSNGQPTWLADGRIVFTSFSGNTATLRWVDPANPTDVHTIVTTGLSSEHAAPIR